MSNIQAYLEFFTCRENAITLKEVLGDYPNVNYHIVDSAVSGQHMLLYIIPFFLNMSLFMCLVTSLVLEAVIYCCLELYVH